MNKITKLLFAFVAVASFSLTSCEPDYVTDGSTVPSEAYVKVIYLDNDGNVTSTKEYSYDKTNSQVSGTRAPKQDAEGNSYTESQIVFAPFEQNPELPSIRMVFEFLEEENNYEFNNSFPRNTARIVVNKINIFDSTEGYIDVSSYDILNNASVQDMYFRSRSEFSFFAIDSDGKKCKVEGTATTNFKL
ncbi:MAG TPA: hypothetical protein VKY32_00845 [Flavobacterium sp.]|nr:hypothetical protein [Flavobacterium sp.]